jgi:hypothetical protein
MNVGRGSILLSSPLNQLGCISPNQLKVTIGFKLNDGALLKENGNIHIPRMEIATSVLNVFVGGDYGLDGKTNLHIEVPLNNITQRDRTKKMKTVSNKERGGTSVFLKPYQIHRGKLN